MPSVSISIVSSKPLPFKQAPASGQLDSDVTGVLCAALRGMGAMGVQSVSYQGVEDTGAALPAIGGFAVSGGAGAIGVVIGGSSVTATATGDDEDDAALVAAAVNAAGGLSGQFQASSVSASAQFVSVVAGDKLLFNGAAWTAYPLGVSLPDGGFAIGVSDAATAINFAAAFNKAYAARDFIAIAASNIVSIIQKHPGAVLPGNSLNFVSATITGSTFALGNGGLVWTTLPSSVGNAVTYTATGTGVSVFSGNAGFLAGGTGFSGITLSVRLS